LNWFFWGGTVLRKASHSSAMLSFQALSRPKIPAFNMDTLLFHRS